MASTNKKSHGVARVISKRGFCSRKKAELLVHEGRVKLRGKIVLNPETPAFNNDEILVDGNKVNEVPFVYFMMNKPRGYITTANDEKKRKTVMDLFNEQYFKMFPNKTLPHISPVGRLDAASEGLLLFTNNTEWANNILQKKVDFASEIKISNKNEKKKSPEKQNLTKIYRVQVSGHLTENHLAQLEKGLIVPPRVFGEKEEFMHVVSAKIHKQSEKNCWLEITLDEGKNREIRRMLAYLGFEVLRLIRIKFSDYELGDLKLGCIREISINSKNFK